MGENIEDEGMGTAQPTASLVERVARALAEADTGDVEHGYRDLARAAIRAMREPTEGMKVAGEKRLDFDDRDSGPHVDEFHRSVCGHVFSAMIDAALAEASVSERS